MNLLEGISGEQRTLPVHQINQNQKQAQKVTKRPRLHQGYPRKPEKH